MNYTSTTGDGRHLFVKSRKSLCNFDLQSVNYLTKHKIWLPGFCKGSSTTFAQTHGP